jgi:hypothetical protein
LTNDDCEYLHAAYNTSQFFRVFSEEMVKFLPIGSNSLVSTTSITCKPAVSFQKRPGLSLTMMMRVRMMMMMMMTLILFADQAAYVSVTFELTTLYYLFPAMASYVTFPNTALDLEVLYPEETAPLSPQAVLTAAQRSIYDLVLYGTRANFSLSCPFLSTLLDSLFSFSVVFDHLFMPRQHRAFRTSARLSQRLARQLRRQVPTTTERSSPPHPTPMRAARVLLVASPSLLVPRVAVSFSSLSSS